MNSSHQRQNLFQIALLRSAPRSADSDRINRAFSQLLVPFDQVLASIEKIIGR